MFDNAVIEGCTNEGEVTARENYAGGIAGVGGYNNIENEQFKITNCINSGKITAGESYAGGIIGYIKEQVREHIDKNTCTNTGEIIAPNYKGDFVGNE